MMDVYKKTMGEKHACPFWSCWENGARNYNFRKWARKYARHVLRQRDEREWRETA